MQNRDRIYKNQRIMIVDDVVENIQLIGTILRENDYSVSIAQSGEQALNMISDDIPDLILLDILMPDMDGFETCQRLKENSATEHIPVIFLSALSDTTNKIDGFKKGAVDYVTKPVEEEELLARVKTHLMIKNLHEELEKQNDQLEEKVRERTCEVEQKNKALEESKEKYRTLVNNLPVAVYKCALDKEWTLEFISDVITEISGYLPTDFIDKNQLTLGSIIHPNDRALVEEAVLAGISRKVPYNVEYRIVHANGAIRWIYDEGHAFYSNAGYVTHLDGVLMNITERKMIEQEFLQAQKMEAIGTLAAGIAHDFNNVLGGIMGRISLMERKIQKENQIECNSILKHLSFMNKCGERATDMVKQLLSLSSRREKSIVELDLKQSIKDVLEICKSTFDKRIVILPFDFDGIACVRVDPTQLEQALLNICINAGHAMTIMRNSDDKAGGELGIKIEKLRSDRYLSSLYPEVEETIQYLRISISDTGIGINKDTLNKMFHPFFTTKQKNMGSGLGLSVVHGIIKQHGGFINVYSQKDIGTTFNVYLPSVETDKASEVDIGKDSLLRGEGLVLVVEDEEIMRETARSILTEYGYEIVMAEDGKQAIEVYNEKKDEIAVVLLDLVLPVYSGNEVFFKLKKINNDIKVLLTSGALQDERIQEMLNGGCQGFIQKPYTAEGLVKSLQEIIA